MIIESGPIKKVVTEYDIIFKGGLPLPLTIDEANGDTITFEPDKTIKVHIAPKPAPNNPDVMVPAENYIIYDEILYINFRTRELTQFTPTQQTEFKSLFKTHPTVQ